MANSSSWNKDLPDGNTYVRQADDILRSNQSALQATLLEEHYFGSTETARAGVHKLGSARAYVAASSALPAPPLEPQGRLVVTSDTAALYAFLSASTTPTKIFSPSDYYTRSASDASYQAKGSYATTGHLHDDRYYTEAESNALFQPKGSYAAAVHTHDDRYYTESEVDARLASYSTVGHNHDGRYYTEGEADARFQPKGSYPTALSGSAAIPITNVAAGSFTDIYINVPGAAAGDVVAVGVPIPSSDIIAVASVVDAGDVRARFYNTDAATGHAISAQTIKVLVFN